MTKVYKQAKDKNVATNLVYGNEENSIHYLYADAAHTKKLDKDTVFDLFMKGMTILADGNYYRPVSYKKEGSGETESSLVNVTDTTTPVAFYSKEKTTA